MSSKAGRGGLLLHSENKPNGGVGQGLYEGEMALSNPVVAQSKSAFFQSQ
jgi:hypothetical protein